MFLNRKILAIAHHPLFALLYWHLLDIMEETDGYQHLTDYEEEILAAFFCLVSSIKKLCSRQFFS